MTPDEAAARIFDLAVETAENARSDADLSWADYAAVLEKCSNVVCEQRFGPQGGATDYNYSYRQWVGYHPPGFNRYGDQPVPGES
jgi:hypothetical protein